jgi:hypothetical protein
LIQADEIQRIESIVADIEQLRIQYQNSQDELVKSKENIKSLENQIDILKKQEILKEKQVKSCKNKKVKKVKPKEITLKTIVYKRCEDDNPFPKLLMKNDTKIKYFKPSSFRLNKNAAIYNARDGVIIENWEDKTSLTSNQRTKNWIKITGYFVDMVWRKAEREMWLQANDATKR